MKKLLVGLSFISAFAYAAPVNSDWKVLVESSDDGNVYYTSPTQDSELDVMTGWFRIEENDPYAAEDALEVFIVTDCAAQKIGGSKVISYDKNNNIIEKFEIATALAPLEPLNKNDDFELMVFKLYCE